MISDVCWTGPPGEVISNRNAESTLALVPDCHSRLRVAVDRARPFDPEVHYITLVLAC
jgi:hypothetical protein